MTTTHPTHASHNDTHRNDTHGNDSLEFMHPRDKVLGILVLILVLLSALLLRSL